ncbi:MAG: hypothetical protein DRH08_06135 [Deltaproteobacteria bacterium]|nr:MAG: hypothetical protein DRH08_06135 [Deltaproteobacteria bacterium]
MWQFNRLLDATTSGANDLLFDGRYVAVLSASAINFFDFKDYLDPDSLPYGSPEVPNTDTLITNENISMSVAKTFNHGGVQFVYLDNHYFIVDGTVFSTIKKVDDSGTLVDTITLPEVMNSNLAVVNGNLWCTSYTKEDVEDEQWLYSFNSVGTQLTKTTIPRRHQLEERYLSTDYNGHVLITEFNELSVAKHDHVTGTYISSIRVSREPFYIKTLSDRTVFVASTDSAFDPEEDRYIGTVKQASDAYDTGILYAIDTILDAQQTNYETLGKCLGIAEDGDGDMWMTTERVIDGVKALYRITLSNNEVKTTQAWQLSATQPSQPQDYTISEEQLLSTDFKKSIKTEPFTFQKWDGVNVVSVNVPSLHFFITGSHLQGHEMNEMYNVQNIFTNSTTMVSTGKHSYIGD